MWLGIGLCSNKTKIRTTSVLISHSIPINMVFLFTVIVPFTAPQKNVHCSGSFTVYNIDLCAFLKSWLQLRKGRYFEFLASLTAVCWARSDLQLSLLIGSFDSVTSRCICFWVSALQCRAQRHDQRNLPIAFARKVFFSLRFILLSGIVNAEHLANLIGPGDGVHQGAKNRVGSKRLDNLAISSGKRLDLQCLNLSCDRLNLSGKLNPRRESNAMTKTTAFSLSFAF